MQVSVIFLRDVIEQEVIDLQEKDDQLRTWYTSFTQTTSGHWLPSCHRKWFDRVSGVPEDGIREKMTSYTRVLSSLASENKCNSSWFTVAFTGAEGWISLSVEETTLKVLPLKWLLLAAKIYAKSSRSTALGLR